MIRTIRLLAIAALVACGSSSTPQDGGSASATRGFSGGFLPGPGLTLSSLQSLSPTVAGLVDTGSLTLSGTYSPVSIATQQDNYLNGDATATTALTLRITPTADLHITGLSIGQVGGREVRLHNTSTTKSVFLDHEGTASTTTNRFTLPELAGRIIPPLGSCALHYSAATSRFRVVDTCGVRADCAAGQRLEWTGTSWSCRNIGDYYGTHFELVDEWFNTVTPNYTNAASGTAAATTSVASTGNRIGIVELQTGTTTTGSVRYHGLGQATTDFTAMSSSFEAVIAIPTLSTSTDAFTVAIGYVAGLPTADITNGCYYEYDHENVAAGNKNPTNTHALECASANGSARTQYLVNGSGNSDESFPLGTAVVGAGTWPATNILHLKIVQTGSTRCEFYTCVASVCTKVCDINTNLPTSGNRPSVGFDILKSAGTNNRNLDVEYTRLVGDLNSVRSP